jgi:hypothetical protein
MWPSIVLLPESGSPHPTRRGEAPATLSADTATISSVVPKAIAMAVEEAAAVPLTGMDGDVVAGVMASTSLAKLSADAKGVCEQEAAFQPKDVSAAPEVPSMLTGHKVVLIAQAARPAGPLPLTCVSPVDPFKAFFQLSDESKGAVWERLTSHARRS